MATALKKVGLLQTDNLDEISDQVMCGSDSKACAYNACPRCKDRRCQILHGTHKVSDEISYPQWVVKKSHIQIVEKCGCDRQNNDDSQQGSDEEHPGGPSW